MSKEEKQEAYEALVNIEEQVADLHNTLNYWLERLLEELE